MTEPTPIFASLLSQWMRTRDDLAELAAVETVGDLVWLWGWDE